MTYAARLTLAALVLGMACAAARGGESAGAPKAKAPVASSTAAVSVARATRLSGTVEFRRAAEAAFAALTEETDLLKGDEVRTGRLSSAELELVDKSRLTLGEEASLVLREVRGKGQADRTLLDLDEGMLGLTVEKLGERQRFEISTPVAVCGVRGTRFALGHVNPAGGPKANDRGTTTLTVGAGLVNADCRNPAVGGAGGVNVAKGQSVAITWNGIGKLVGVKAGDFQGLMRELPGWHPDPADPNLARLQAAAPRAEGGWWNRGAGRGNGAFDRGGRGFSNAAESAILGSVGLGDKAGRRGDEDSGSGRGQTSGDAFAAAIAGDDPVLTIGVGSGSYTYLPPGPVGAPNPVTIRYGR